MKEYEIWREGYATTGESSGAAWMGTARGTNFLDAVQNHADKDPDFKRYLSKQGCSYWGCRLHDNEADARRNFG